MSELTFAYSARSDVGLRRTSNQDSGYAGPHLLVLADGMGGAAGGDVASSVAVAELADLDGDEHELGEAISTLRERLELIQKDLVDFSTTDAALAGLGTTCTALLRSGNSAAMVHIGDSRAYVLRQSNLYQVTVDHTYVQHLVEAGEISAAEAETHPQRSLLLKVLHDGGEQPQLDETVRELKAGERWLLCSDGISSYVSAQTIAETLVRIRDLDACAEELIDLGLRAGGQDNLTAIVADVVEASTLPSTTPQIVGAAAVDRARPTRGGSSAAARAAALSAPTPTQSGTPKKPRRSRWRRWVVLALVVLLLAAGVGGAYAWTQTRYYVGAAQGNVGIFQGVPQEFGPIQLSHLRERTNVSLADLPASPQRERVERGIATDSFAAAEELVDTLRQDAQSS